MTSHQCNFLTMGIPIEVHRIHVLVQECVETSKLGLETRGPWRTTSVLVLTVQKDLISFHFEVM